MFRNPCYARKICRHPAVAPAFGDLDLGVDAPSNYDHDGGSLALGLEVWVVGENEKTSRADGEVSRCRTRDTRRCDLVLTAPNTTAMTFGEKDRFTFRTLHEGS